MAVIILYSRFQSSEAPEYTMDIHPAHVPLKGGMLACLPFILIFIFLTDDVEARALYPWSAHGH